jgi:hypothetical protein
VHRLRMSMTEGLDPAQYAATVDTLRRIADDLQR